MKPQVIKLEVEAHEQAVIVLLTNIVTVIYKAPWWDFFTSITSRWVLPEVWDLDLKTWFQFPDICIILSSPPALFNSRISSQMLC